MKRYVLLFFIMLSALNTYAQSNMSDSQVMEFIVKEHNKGTSQAQIVTKLMQNGVDISQIRRVRDTYEKMKKGNSSLGNVSSKDGNNDRSRKNNGQTRPGLDKKKIAEKTMQDYEDSENEARKYSDKRLDAETNHQNTYDEDDKDYLLMRDEMDDWLPQDTATMYKNLLKQLKKKKKKVWGRDIFNNRNLSFEPNMNMALPANYRLGPGDAVFIDIYGASQKSYDT
ncbi:MAG: capsule biosynthesis protein, partial [Prevotella sp.]